MSEDSTTKETQAEPTEAELKAYRESMKKFYDEQMPLLKKQNEYEKILADIDESRARRMSFTIRMAQMLAPPPDAPPEGEMPPNMDEPKTERKLKKE
jgi:hypothetical protein